MGTLIGLDRRHTVIQAFKLTEMEINRFMYCFQKLFPETKNLFDNGRAIQFLLFKQQNILRTRARLFMIFLIISGFMLAQIFVILCKLQFTRSLVSI